MYDSTRCGTDNAIRYWERNIGFRNSNVNFKTDGRDKTFIERINLLALLVAVKSRRKPGENRRNTWKCDFRPAIMWEI